MNEDKTMNESDDSATDIEINVDSLENQEAVAKRSEHSVLFGDPFLQDLAVIANTVNDYPLSITLYVHGLVVTGKLMGLHDYILSCVDDIAEMLPPATDSIPERGELTISFLDALKEDANYDRNEMQETRSTTRFIHLRDGKYLHLIIVR